MKVNELRIHFHAKESSSLSLWVDCSNEKDVRLLIEVLKISQKAMVDWDNAEDKVE